MTIKLKAATEQSTYVIAVSFLDTAGNAVTPKLASWTLKDESKAVVNSRLAVNLPVVGNAAAIVLTGADLALPDESAPLRYLLIEALYDSVLYGNDLNLREEARFTISNLVALA